MPVSLFGRRSRRAIVLLFALLAGGALLPSGRAGAASDAGREPALAGPACPSRVTLAPVVRLGRLGRKLAKAETIRILAIGSSSTEGIGATSPSRSYPARLEAGLKLRWPKADVSVTNAGIGGETVAATVARLERLVRAGNFDLVIWQLGTNDAVRGDDMESFRSQALRGIAAGAAAGADVVLVDPQYYPGIKDLAAYERFVSIVKEIGEGRHVPVFGRYAMMKRWKAQGDGVLLATLAPDRFHMNDRGYACLAEALTADIDQMSEPQTAPPPIALSATR
jgi:lysophospholipase L1-like esterase